MAWAGPPLRVESLAPETYPCCMKISRRSQEKFADFAARHGTLDKIRDVYETRDLSLPEAFAPSSGRERRSLCEAAEAGLELSDPSVSERLLLAYVDAIEDWGKQGDALVPEARALIRSLQRDGTPIDGEGRLSRPATQSNDAATATFAGFSASAARDHAPPGDRAAVGTEQADMAIDRRAVMVVHGRNEAARKAMFGFLRALGLKPLEWSTLVAGTGKGAPYIGEVLDYAFSRAAAVVVLFTPDDEARLRPPFQLPNDPSFETALTPQARPNVLFEAGMAFGLHPNRTILVELGRLRPFSDVYGRHVIRLDGTARPLREIAQRLRAAECEVDTTGDDWSDPQLFPAADSESG